MSEEKQVNIDNRTGVRYNNSRNFAILELFYFVKQAIQYYPDIGGVIKHET